MTDITDQSEYRELVGYISSTYTLGRQKAIQAVNASLLDAYWQIGQHIIEFEQGGAAKARYGARLLPMLSKDLSMLHGKGFSISNLIRMRQFFLSYPIYATVSHKLGWSHYVELLKLDNDLERSFYEKQGVHENWSVRELKRQISASLFLRLANTKNKSQIGELANQGQAVTHPMDIIRDPEGDNPPIGIVLAKEKSDLLVKYAMHNVSSQLFVSKYQLYLPDKDELRAVIEEQLNDVKDQ